MGFFPAQTVAAQLAGATIPGSLTIGGSLNTTGVFGAAFPGGVDVTLAGVGLSVKEGSNAKQGTAVLNGTTAVVVANTSVTANSRIFMTHQSISGTPGVPYVSARSAGVSFSVTSTAATDLGTVAYEIFEPG